MKTKNLTIMIALLLTFSALGITNSSGWDDINTSWAID